MLWTQTGCSIVLYIDIWPIIVTLTLEVGNWYLSIHSLMMRIFCTKFKEFRFINDKLMLLGTDGRSWFPYPIYSRTLGVTGSSPDGGYFFSFFLNFILDFLLELFRSSVYIYQYKALKDKLQNMPKSVKRPL